CLAPGHWDAPHAIALRILAAAPGHAEAQALLSRAERGAAQPPAVGRNDPCPCGRGEEDKQCHGALSGVASQTAAQAAPASIADPDSAVRRAIVMHESGDLEAAERGYRAGLALAPRGAPVRCGPSARPATSDSDALSRRRAVPTRTPGRSASVAPCRCNRSAR